ncbi:MAG: fibronectin type III domain-containing protein, partial [Zetaproteobacteria bacterium]|nr:fibronectin type III domain-containing protein [Zetaproteobacteria bacterium]
MKHHSTLFIIFSTLISSIVGCNEQLGLQESDYASFDATSVQVQKASSSAVRVFWTPFAARGQVDISYAVHLRKVDGSQSFDAEILSKFRAESFSTDQGEVWQLPIADETLRNHLIGLTPALVSTSAAGNERLDYAEDMSGSVFAVTIVPKFGGESRTADATSTTLLFGLGASARFPGFTSAEASGSSGIKLSWDAIESVNKYEIYQYKLSNVLGTNDLSAASTETAAVNFDLVGVKVKLHNLKANQFSIVQPTKIATIENQNFFEISDIPLDKFNVYEVRPHGQSISGNTNFAEVYILEKPMTDFAGLEDIVLNYSTGAITLNWTAASDSAVTGYNIYRGTDFAELIATVEKPATSYVHSSQDSSILLGVKAKDQFGHEDANVVMLQGGGQGLTNAGSSSAQLEVSPDGFDFGEVIVGQSSATKVFTILNKGDAVILTTMTSSKPTQAVITEDNCVGISLAKDSTCTVSVYFVPSALGLINASLTAEYAPQIAGIDSNVSFAVKATGVTELTTFLGVTGASNVGHDSVDLTWVDDSKALSYLIYSQTGSGDNITLTKLATLDASASSNGYTLTGLTAQTDYLLRVYAQTQAGTLATNEKTVSFTTTVAVTLASLDNHIFPSSPANVGDTKSYDANNTDDSGETNTTYTCFYDNDIDGSLASGASACSTITGVSLDAQFSSNGRLSWVIDSSSAGKAYELHFTATMGNGSDTAISKVNVSYGHDRTNVVFESDASFANSYSPCHYQNNWGDAPNLTSAAALSSTMTKSANFTPSTSSGCAGAGTTADPYRFVFDGTNDKFSLTGMDDETGMLFAGWVKVSDLTDGGTIFSNGTSTLGAGVRLEQTYVDGRSYFVYTVGGLNVYSDTKSAMLANSPVVYYQLGTSNGGDDIPNIGTLGGTHDGLNSIIPSLGVSGLAQNTVTDTAFYFDGGRTIAEAYSTYAHVTGSRTLEAYFKADEVDRTAYIAGFGLDNLGNLALGID